MDAAASALLLNAARSAVRVAARLTTAVQRNHAIAAEFAAKADASPVTTADFGAQAVVSAMLQASCAASGKPFRVVGEESAAVLRATKQHLLPHVIEAVEAALPGAATVRGRAWSVEGVCAAIDAGACDGDPREAYWVLDPVDGTKGFLRGASGQYAVGLAYVESGRPVIAAIACPNLPYPAWGVGADGGAGAGAGSSPGTLFSATAGGGAFMEPLFSDDADAAEKARQRISVSRTTDAASAVVCESFDAGHSDHAAASAVSADLGITAAPRRLDSMCKYGMLGRGDADIYLRFPKPGYVEHVWDHAPGCLLVQEAGGTVTDVRGAPLDFSRGRALSENRGVVASNGSLHAQVLRAVAKALAL